MPESSLISLLKEPEDSDVLRTIFLECITEYQLIDEALIGYTKKILAEIKTKGTFDATMFNLCVEEGSKKTVHNLTSQRLMYLALHHSLFWHALLNAEVDPALKESIFFTTVAKKEATMPITKGFKEKLLHVLATNIFLDLTKKISFRRNPEAIDKYLDAIGSNTAEELLTDILHSSLPSTTQTSTEIMIKDCLECFNFEETDISLYAERMLNVFEKNSIIKRLTVLCRFGMMHAYDTLQSLFLSFLSLIQNTRAFKASDERIKHQLATLIVFSFFQKILDAEILFGERARFYRQDFESVIVLRCALSYHKEGAPKNSTFYSSLFEPIIKRIGQKIQKEDRELCTQAIEILLHPDSSPRYTAKMS